jgi:uncharacterized protein (TIGR03000 family)
MRRHRVGVTVLLGAAALLLAPATGSAQVGFGAPYHGGPSYRFGYGYYPSGGGSLSWPSAYSYTQRYYWYGDNWPYPGYYVGTYHGAPYFPGDKTSSSSRSSGSSSSSGGDSYYSYGAAPRTGGANTAQVHVRLPDPNAEVWIEGKRTEQRGEQREFVSPALDPDTNYTYEVRARWTENGRAIDRTKTVPVRANGVATVDFR